MILLIDNYDSFVYNLGRYIGRLDRERKVVRNDAVTVEDIGNNPPEAIIISPGPCTPSEAGISKEIIKELGATIPILGICLGHQCIGEVYGGRTVRANKPVHGQTSSIIHDKQGIFDGLPSPMQGTRYHSLVTELTANSPLEISAHTDNDAIIMAMRHRTHPVYGLQFHPEAVLTEHGLTLMQNFVTLADQWNRRKAAA